ncbi:MAG: hypothetical protein AAF310_05760, partial [Myxococcota bacterium]
MGKTKKRFFAQLRASVSMLLLSACTSSTQNSVTDDDNRETITHQAITFMQQQTEEAMRSAVQERQNRGQEASSAKLAHFYALKEPVNLRQDCSQKELLSMQIFSEIKEEISKILTKLATVTTTEKIFARTERVNTINDAYFALTERAVDVIGEFRTKTCEASLEVIKKVRSESI